MNKQENIVLESNNIQVIGKNGPIFLNTNKEIHLGSGTQILMDVGPVGSKDPQNKVLINSPRIEFGIPNISSPQEQLEPVVKYNQLVLILNEMLEILQDSIESPNLNRTKGEIETLKKKMDRIKSTITYTI